MTIDVVLREPEGKTLELKRDVSSPRPALRTLVAFANSAGGRLVLGVEDGTRHVVGVADPLRLEERLTSLIADSIAPQLLPDIDIVPWRSTHLVVVQVHPSPLRPHHIRAEGEARGTYVRLGSTDRRADAALIAELGRRPPEGTHDEQPLLDLDQGAIDLDAVATAFADHRPMRPRDLVTLGVLAEHAGRTVPTLGGVILFGRDRLMRVPDAWIQAGRFAGTDRSDILDRADITAFPVQALDEAVRFVERNTRTGADIGRLRRRDIPTVPPVALREALVNGVVHADYSQRGAPIRVAVFDDRVEVESPGILLPGLTIDDLREGVSRLRNRVIGRVFKELGLIEQWGSGVGRMTVACTAAGLPAPGLAEIGLRFRVTIRTTPSASVPIDPFERRLLDQLGGADGRSTAELARAMSRTPRTIQQRLAQLRDRGLVVAIGSGPTDPHRRWYLAGIPARVAEPVERYETE